MLGVIRENLFVREFDWDGTRFLDSKYRTCELPFRANFFIEQWLASDITLHRDMEASLAEFPRTFIREGSAIINFLRSVDQSCADRASVLMKEQSEPSTPENLALHLEIYKGVLTGGAKAWALVGEDQWFRIYQSIAELRIDEKAEFLHDCPTGDQLIALADSLPEGLHKWGVEMVCRQRGRFLGDTGR